MSLGYWNIHKQSNMQWAFCMCMGSGKKIDEGYRMMYVKLILNTALSYIGRSAKHYIAEVYQPWWIKLNQPQTESITTKRGSCFSDQYWNIQQMMNKQTHWQFCIFMSTLLLLHNLSPPTPPPPPHLKEKITGLCSQY